MELKDWLLVIIPILGNGVIIFIFQKLFEKKQRQLLIECEYFATIRSKIDASLALFSQATKITNYCSREYDDQLNNTLHNFFHSCFDIHYYYIQNQIIFGIFKKQDEQLTKILMEWKECSSSNQAVRSELVSIKVNKLNNILQEMKKISIR